MEGLIASLVLWGTSIFLLTLGVVYLYVKSVYRYFENRGLPYDKPTFPFGSLSDVVYLKKSVALNLAKIYAKNRHQKLVGIFSFWTKQILLRDPAILKAVLIKDFEIFQDRGVYYNKEKDPLSAHLFSLEGDAWKFLRAKLTPTFSSGKIKLMHSNIIDCANILLTTVTKQHSTNKSVDFQSIFFNFALTVIASSAFGLEIDSLTTENSQFAKMTKKMVEPTLERVLTLVLMFNPQVAKRLNMCLVPTVVSEFFLCLVKDNIRYRELNKIIRNDYFQQLIELNKSETEGSLRLSEEELAAQSFVFLVAGSETTASTMSFCLYELAGHPDIQARLHRDLDALPDLSYESVNGCEYLDMVVSETLRKHPSFGFLNRECSQDYQIPDSNYVIEKGTQVLVSIYGMHHDPDFYPDPEVFNPERFSKENKEHIKPYTYMPFGEGPRYCIGRRFGLIVVKTGLALFLRRFRVLRPPNSSEASSVKIEPRAVISMAEGGLWLDLEERF